MNSRYVTVKEIAADLEVSDCHVRNHIRSWGLHKAQDKSSAKPVRFFRDQARKILNARGCTVTF